MPKALPQEAIERYRRDGYYFPLPVLSGAEAAGLRAGIEAFEATQGGALEPAQRSKSHLLFKRLDDLIRDPRALDPVEDLIGPDIVCWNTLFWIKEPRTPSFVSWHQDIHYRGLEGGAVVTAWLALSPATPDSGCMRVLYHKVVDIDPFHGAHRSARPIRREAQAGPRRAARCGTPTFSDGGQAPPKIPLGTRPRRCAPPEGPVCPTRRAGVPHPKGRCAPPEGPVCPTRRAGRFLPPAASRAACGARTAARTRS